MIRRLLRWWRDPFGMRRQQMEIDILAAQIEANLMANHGAGANEAGRWLEARAKEIRDEYADLR